MKKSTVSLVLLVVLLFSFAMSVSAAATWTENVEMRNLTNKHFLTWTKAAITTGFIQLVGGGTQAFWSGLVTGVMANGVTSETHNVYFDIRYYWQPSDDPQLPYYIKQVTNCYSDSDRTDFIGSKTRYYYSSLPF